MSHVVISGQVLGDSDRAGDLADLLLGLTATGSVEVSTETGDGAEVLLQAAPAEALTRLSSFTANVGRTWVEVVSNAAVVACQGLDEVWVCTPWEQDQLTLAGVDRERVVVVPTPIDTTWWAPRERSASPFTFLTISTDDHGAGADAVLEAFVTEFRRRDAVRLVLMLTSTFDRDPVEVEADLRRYAQSLVRDPSSLPEISVLHGTPDDEQLRELYAGADAYVRAPRRSETGRDLLRAMAMGLPVVSTAPGALCGLVTQERALVIPGRVTATGDLEADGRRLRGHLRSLLRPAGVDAKLSAAWSYVVGTHDVRVVGGVAAQRLVRLAAGEFSTPAPLLAAPVADRLHLALEDSAPFDIEWRGVFWNPSGYAQEARSFVSGLVGLGRTVAARRLSAVEEGYRERLSTGLRDVLDAALAQRLPGTPAVSVVNAPAYAFHRRSAPSYAIGRTMSETDGLCQQWVERCNAMDEVWVPTDFNARSFRAAGVTVPITVVPDGVDAEHFRPGVDPIHIPGTCGVVVLGVFQWSGYKGWDVLLRAWYDAFRGSDEATLVLRTYVQGVEPGLSRRRIEKDIEDFARRQLDIPSKGLGRLVLLTDTLSDDELPALYAAADALVAPSRGEGWGLPQLEALSCGLPVIATAWGGTTEFLHDGNSLQVAVEGLCPTGQTAPWYAGQRWAEPSVSSLTAALRRVVDDPEGVAELGRAGRREVEQRWTWEHSVAVADARLSEIERDLRSRCRPPRAEGSVPVRWEGRLFQHHSLASANREIVGRLVHDEGLDLDLVVQEHPQQAPSPTLVPWTLPSPSAPAVTVRHQWPPDLTPVAEGRLVLVQPWEYGGLPDSWVSALQQHVDEAWVYTSWLRDCYLRSGVPAEKVHIVPLGVDTALFTPEGPTYDLPVRASVRLLFVGGAIGRKGLDLLLAAYVQEFGRDEDVALVIKAFGGTSVYAGSPLLDAARGAAADPDGPEVVLVEEDLSPQQLAALYRSCSALVHPYRGEGYGLTVAEGMASGLPVVTTGYGAALDFCSDQEALLVPASEVPLPDEHTLPPSRTGYFWAEPDLAALRAALRRIATDQVLRQRLGRAGRKAALERLSWDRTAQVAGERLRAIAVPDRTVFVHDLDVDSENSLQVVAGYAGSFGPQDPTTLVLQAPGLSDEELERAAQVLTQVLAAAGEDEPDVLLLTRPLTDGDISGRSHRVLHVPSPRDGTSWRELAHLPV